MTLCASGDPLHSRIMGHEEKGPFGKSFASRGRSRRGGWFVGSIEIINRPDWIDQETFRKRGEGFGSKSKTHPLEPA